MPILIPINAATKEQTNQILFSSYYDFALE